MKNELEKLRDRLKDTKSFHVSWGPGVLNLSEDERAKCINDVLDQIEKESLLSTDEQMRKDFDVIYKHLKGIIHLSRLIMNDDTVPSNIKEVARGIFTKADFSALHAGNWIERT